MVDLNIPVGVSDFESLGKIIITISIKPDLFLNYHRRNLLK